MTLCGKNVRTIEPRNLPCICEKDHEGGCNPFSANPNLNFKREIKKEEATTIKVLKIPEEYLWENGKIRCPWHSPNGPCIYIIGHYPEIPHKELSNEAEKS